MITGEFKKIFRNKTFLVITIITALINILTILYCSEMKDKRYIEYKNTTQQEYSANYDIFINELNKRGELLLQAHKSEASDFYKRNIKKTQKDYSKLSNIIIDNSYNIGMEEYAEYTYGIFFCILFSFISLEFIYFAEKKNRMIFILRSTKKGRKQMIISKWFVYISNVFAFSIIQEIITLLCFHGIYSLGNLNASVQSLSLFRDCTLHITMFEGVILVILNRIIISLLVGSIIFFFGIVICNTITSIAFTIALLVIQYFFYITISIDSSLDKLCCLNIFYLWDIRKFIGVYHNINFFNYPFEKNISMHFLAVVIIMATILIGPIIFSKRYQIVNKKFEIKILKLLRILISKILHIKSLFFNELYKLLFLQKKWIILLIFILLVSSSINSYIPENTYQTAYDAVYHMYLSNIEGKSDNNSKKFICDEQNYINNLEKKIEDAVNSENDTEYMQLEAEYSSRKEAFDRLIAQYDKFKNNDNDAYFIDEFNFKSIIQRYDRDVILFMISGIILVILISGLFASDKENRILTLSFSTKNGREKLFRTKLFTSAFILLLIFTFIELPMINGYKNTIKFDCLYQKLSYIYDPDINSSVTILGLLVMLIVVRFILYLIIGTMTIGIALKTRNEFMTSVVVCTIVIIACLVFYFLKTNLTWTIIHVIGG